MEDMIYPFSAIYKQDLVKEEAENLCNRVALIDNGKLLDIDRPESMINKMGNFAVDPVSYTHLTLPTNREV